MPTVRERRLADVDGALGNTRGEPKSRLPGAVRHDQLLSDLRNRRRKRLFVTGGGGSGKSELLRLLAYELAVDGTPLIPLFMPLRRWRDGENLLNLAAGVGADALRPIARRGGIAFLFDGLDEVHGDRARFDSYVERLLDEFEDSTFVLSGRPGSLGALHVCGFDHGCQYTLQPLAVAEMHRYVLGYCDEQGFPERGPDVWKRIAASGGASRQHFRQPFMLSMACATYAERAPSTTDFSDPRELVGRGLKQLLYWRKYDPARNPSGPLHLDDDACLDALGAVFASSIDTNYRLDFERAVRVIGSADGLSRAEAERRLSELAPGSGLLETTSGREYRAVNRAIADYLAARWIARNGTDSQKGVYPRPLSADSAQDSILSLVGSRVWSDTHRELLVWLYWELARCRPKLLVRIGQWLLKHLQGAEVADGMPGPVDDIRRTLLNRYVDLVSAIRPEAPIWEDAEAQELGKALSAFLPPNVDPFPGLDYGALRATHLSFRAACGEWVRDDLLNTSDVFDAILVATAIVEGWPEHDDAVKNLLLKKLRAQIHADKIARLAEFVAERWPEHAAEAKTLLRREFEIGPRPREWEHLIPVLLAICPEDRDAIRVTLLETLDELLDDDDWIDDRTIVLGLLLDHYSTECRPLLRQVLKDVMNPHHACYGNVQLLSLFADNWPQEPGLREAITTVAFEEGRSTKELMLVRARVSHGDESVGDLLLETLAGSRSIGEINALGRALADGWAHRQDVRDEIRNQLRDGDLDFSGPPLASALARGWPGDASAAATILSRYMDDKLVWRESWFPWVVVICNKSAVDWLSDPEGCGWPLVNDGTMTAPFHGKIRSGYPEPGRARCFFLVVRRDGVKRGLDGRLLPPADGGSSETGAAGSGEVPIAPPPLEPRELVTLRFLHECELRDEEAPKQSAIADKICMSEDAAAIMCKKLENSSSSSIGPSAHARDTASPRGAPS